MNYGCVSALRAILLFKRHRIQFAIMKETLNVAVIKLTAGVDIYKNNINIKCNNKAMQYAFLFFLSSGKRFEQTTSALD